MVNDPRIRAGIFAGESGGDYDALYGYRNRDPNSQFGGTRVSEMSVGDVIKFTMPNSPYAQSVKDEIGRVATPVGAYQIVGTTLRNAVNSLGMDPNTPFNQETQDKLGQWVLDQQGVGAWEGYRGPQTGEGLKNFAGDMQVRGADAEKRLQEKEREAGNYERTAVEMLMPHLARGNTGGQELGFGGGAGGGPLDSSAFGFPLGQDAPPGAAPVAPPPAASASSQSPTNITPDLIGADMGAAPPVNAEKEIEADREQRQQRIGEMLMLLSTGLGQMGAGQPVNLAPTLQGFQQMRSDAAAAMQEQERYEQEQEFLRQQTAYKNRMEERRVAAEEGRLRLSEMEFAQSMPGAPIRFDSAIYEPVVAANPALSSVVETARRAAESGNIDLFESANSALQKGMEHLAQAPESVESVNPEKVDYATQRILEGDNDWSLLSGLNDRERKAVSDNISLLQDDSSEPTAMRLARARDDALEAGDIETARSIEEFARLQGGIDPVDARTLELENSVVTNYADRLHTQATEIDGRVSSAKMRIANTSYALDQAMRANESILQAGATTGALTDEMQAITSGIISVFGDSNPIVNYLQEEGYIVDREAYDNLDNASKIIALYAGQKLLEGGGSISDGERAAVLNSLFNTEQSPQTRGALIKRLQVLNEIDTIAANYWDENSGYGTLDIENPLGSLDNVSSAVREYNRLLHVGTMQVSTSVKEMEAIRLGATYSQLGQQDAIALRAQTFQISPVLSQEDAVTFFDQLPAYDLAKHRETGVYTRYFRSSDGLLSAVTENTDGSFSFESYSVEEENDLILAPFR